MRALLGTLAALFVAGCASAPADKFAVYDHKYNTYSFVQKEAANDFIGTSAASSKRTPAWAPANTTPVYDHKYNTYSFVPK